MRIKSFSLFLSSSSTSTSKCNLRKKRLWHRVNQIDFWNGKLATFYPILRPLTIWKLLLLQFLVCWTTLNKKLDLMFNLFMAKLLFKVSVEKRKKRSRKIIFHIFMTVGDSIVALNLQLRRNQILESFCNSQRRFNTIKDITQSIVKTEKFWISFGKSSTSFKGDQILFIHKILLYIVVYGTIPVDTSLKFSCNILSSRSTCTCICSPWHIHILYRTQCLCRCNLKKLFTLPF